MKISRESWILSIICVLDLTTTIWLVSMHGAREGNTLMSYFLEFGFGPFILAKAAMFMIPIALLEWARRSNPKFVIGMLRCGIALYVGIYSMGVFSINANRQRDEDRSQYSALVQKWAELPAVNSEEYRKQASIMRMIPRDLE